MSVQRPTAFVFTKFYPHTNAAHVFRAQVNMLLATGFDVSVATITSQAIEEEPTEATYQRYRHEMALPPVTSNWICFANDAMLNSMNDTARSIVGVDESWVGEMLRAVATDLPIPLKQSCCDNPPDLILCNYLSHLPLAVRLKGPDTRIIVEVHDICSVQHAVTCDLPLSEVDFRAELSAGRSADGLVFVNAEQAAVFNRYGILTPAVTIPPPRPLYLECEWAEALADAEARLDRPALVSATQQMLTRLIGTAENPAGAVIAGLGMRRAGTSRKFLVYIGSDDEWHIRGLSAFLETVFVPHLQPDGYLLAIVGSICDWAGRTHPNLPGVIRTGVLPDLRPIYEMPSILVLPVLGGTGFPNETLDALSSGLPVVGTPLAFRGVDGAEFGARVVELPEMADAIRTLGEARSTAAWREPPPALTVNAYCREWARFLSDRLGRKIEAAVDTLAMSSPLILSDAARKVLTLSPDGLKPIACGSYPITPDTIPQLGAGCFGFYPREGESDWLWASSWYFGFLLEPKARNGTLSISVHKVELIDWASVIDVFVFVDAAPQRIQIGRQTTKISIPLSDIGRSTDEPVLVEFILPEADWLHHDERALSLCITQIETLDEQATP